MEIKKYITGPLQVNTYVLKDSESKEAIIIDLGGSFKRIKDELDKEGFQIKFILNTHGHFDHILGETKLKEDFPEIPIYANENDMSHFLNIKQHLEMWGFSTLNIKAFTPTACIDENTKLDIGGVPIQIFHTPGHSKGSLSYYINGNLFSGDALFRQSIGRTDFIDGNYDELISSIKEKLLTLPDDTVVYPGHGPSTKISDEKMYNPYLV